MSRNLKQAPQYAPQQQAGMAPPGAIPPSPDPIGGGMSSAPKTDPRMMPPVMPPAPMQQPMGVVPPMGVAQAPMSAPQMPTRGSFGFSRPMVRR